MMLEAAIPPSSARAALRARTADEHARIDAAFASFDLTQAQSYRLFLEAHARALPVLEAMLMDCAALPAWRRRLHLLEADLRTLGAELEAAPATRPTLSVPGLHGVLYVLEGSRLGGKLLVRSVGEGLPHAFLAAGHEKGEWRALMERIDAIAAANGRTWLDEAVEGARFAFALYGAEG